MMKKIMCVFLGVILLLIAMIPLSATTEAGLSLSVSDIAPARGAEFTVTVKLQGAAAAKSVALSFDYDTDSVFDVVSGEWLLADTSLSGFDTNTTKTGTAVAAYASAADLNGDLFVLRLRVKEGAPEVNSPVTVTAMIKNGAATIPCTAGTIIMKVACQHTGPALVEARQPSCVEPGWETYYRCENCGQLLAADGITKLSEIPYLSATGIHIDANGEWESDGTKHWHTCSCGATFDETTHSGGTATCKDPAVCSVCGASYGNVNPEKHSGGTATCKDRALCAECGTPYGAFDPDNHVGGTELRGRKFASCSKDGYTGDTHCLGCGEKLADGKTIPATGYHTDADGEWESDGTKHWHTCACGATFDETAHTGGTATCKDKAVCSVCGASYGEVDADHHTGTTYVEGQKEATCFEDGYTGDTYCSDCHAKLSSGETIPAGAHNPASVWSTDETYHWHECQTIGCGNQIDKAEHTGGTATCKDKAICSVCGVVYGEINAANHTGGTEIRGAVDATCAAEGYTGDVYRTVSGQREYTSLTVRNVNVTSVRLGDPVDGQTAAQLNRTGLISGQEYICQATFRYQSVAEFTVYSDPVLYRSEVSPVAFKQSEMTKSLADDSFVPALNGTYTVVSYSSSNPEVATVSDKGRITIVAPGDTVITVNTAADWQYEAGTATMTLHVEGKKAVTVSGIKAVSRSYEAGNTAVTLNYNLAVIDGLLTKDKGKVSVEAVGTMASDAPGTNKQVTITGLRLVGEGADRYELAPTGQQTETTVTIGSLQMNPTAQNVYVEYDGAPHGITVEAAPDGAVIRYGRSADTCTRTNLTFTNAGTYDVYYTVTANGYTDVTGSATVTIRPAVVTVTFDPKNGTSAWTAQVTMGEGLTEPATPVLEGMTFAGWYTTDGYVRKWDFASGKVESAITLEARWVADTYVVSGTVKEADGLPTVDAEVTIQGITVKTDADGWYRITDLLPGTYSVEVQKDGSHVQKAVTLTTADAVVDVTMPKQQGTSSALQTKENMPEIAVEGLDSAADEIRGGADFGDADAVEVVMSVETVNAEDVVEASVRAIQSMTGENTELSFLSIDLTANVTRGAETTPENVAETDSVFEILIPFATDEPEKLVIYRCHEGEAEAFRPLRSAADEKEDGTFYYDAEAQVLHLYTCRFSDYGVGYIERGDINGDGSIDSDDALYLLYHVFFGNEYYPRNQYADYDQDAVLTSDDAIYLLYHIFFPEYYPLY